MTLQKRLKRIMKQRGWRVADLARALDRPYTTVREWVLKGREPDGTPAEHKRFESTLARLEACPPPPRQ